MRKKKIEDIKRAIEQEFPNDFALQQVHIARKILAEEAKEKGISFWKYIKMQVKLSKRCSGPGDHHHPLRAQSALIRSNTNGGNRANSKV